MQKRHYQRGFHVEQNWGSRRSETFAKKERLLVSAQHPAVFPTEIKMLPPDSCDLLTFYDKTEIKVRILELNNTEIRYYYCDDKTRKLKTTARSKVVHINYADKNPKTAPASSPRQDSVVAEKALLSDSLAVAPPIAASDSTSRADTTGGCETIIFRDGIEKRVKILEIGTREIKYRNCGGGLLPLYRRYKSDVFMIVHSDGRREVFEEEKTIAESRTAPAYDAPRPRVRTKSSLAVWAFIVSFSGLYPAFMVGGLAAIVMAVIYLNKNRAQPDIYISRQLAISALIIGVVSALLGGWIIYSTM